MTTDVALAVDWTRCDGHGLCAALAPEHVGRDEWGFPVLPAGPVPPRTARALVAVCPALALRLDAVRASAPPPTLPSVPIPNRSHR